MAQLNLGVAYAQGDGVARDYSESYFWVKVASAGNPLDGGKPLDFTTMLDNISARLSPLERSQSEERAGAWLATHPTKGR